MGDKTAINTFENKIRGAEAMYEATAKAMVPNGPRTLICGCGHEATADAELIAEYLRSGWPQHCGETMVLF